MRIGVAQTPGVRLEQWRETLGLIDDLLRRAAELRADVVVLPECVWPAYCLGTKQAYLDARAGGLPAPQEFVARLQDRAREHQLAICAGYIDEHADRLLNVACLIDRDGQVLGVRSKCLLWGFDHDYFAAGDRIEPIDTSFGRVGLLICADARLPEIPATLVARGARLLLQPTAWVNVGSPQELRNPQPDFLVPARAAEFGVPVASASKWGREQQTDFVGMSFVCDATGHVLAQCGTRETSVIVADVEPCAPRPPELTDVERGHLLSNEPPVPTRSDVQPLDVVLLPPPPSQGGAGGGLEPEQTTDPTHLRSPLSGGMANSHSAPMLAVQYSCGAPTEPSVRPLADGRGVLVSGPLPGLLTVSGADPSRARKKAACGPDPSSTRQEAVSDTLLGAIAAADVRRFAAVRALALQGVHLVLAFGSDPGLMLLRARACENRLFLLHVAAEGWRALDPDGVVIAEHRWPSSHAEPQRVTLEVTRAAHKAVAPGTEMLSGRRPEQYAF